MSRATRHRRGHGGTLVLLAVSAVGVLGFAWPFVADASVGAEHGQSAPWLFAATMALLGLNVLAEEAGGRLDATSVAVIGVLASMGGALRVVGAGTAGLEPVFFFLVVAGRVLPRRLAFLAGALTLLAGSFLTGGLGPWTPFQMLASGWVALGAALLPPARGRLEIGLLAAYGVVVGFAYGAVMNLWFWPLLGASAPPGAGYVPGAGSLVNLRHYAAFYALTSFAWDLPRALLTATLVVVAGAPLLRTLRRLIRPARFIAPAAAGPEPGAAAPGARERRAA